MNINLAVINDTIINDAVVRARPAGTDVAQFDVSTSNEQEGRTVNASCLPVVPRPCDRCSRRPRNC